MQYHWLRNRVHTGDSRHLEKGTYNLADFFTKPLSVKDHQATINKEVELRPQFRYRTRVLRINKI